MTNVVKFPGQEDQPKGSELLRQMADMLEQFEEQGMEAEVAAISLVDGLPAPIVAKNCVTGNDGAMALFNVGVTSLAMMYLGLAETGDYDDDTTIH